jgi:hypothetical protein
MPYAPGVVNRSGEIMYKGLSDTLDRYDMLKKAKEEQDRLEKLRLESIRQFDLGEARANQAEGRLQAADLERIRQFGVNSDQANTVEGRLQAADLERIRQFDLGEARANTVEGRLQKGQDQDYLLKQNTDERAGTAAGDASSISAAALEAARLKNENDTPRTDVFNGSFGTDLIGEPSETDKAVKELERSVGRRATRTEIKNIIERQDKAKDALASILARGSNTLMSQSVAEIEAMNIPEAEKMQRIQALISKRPMRTVSSQFTVERK